MMWYITPEGNLCEAQPTDTEGWFRCRFIHKHGSKAGMAIVTGKLDFDGYVGITKEVFDIMEDV